MTVAIDDAPRVGFFTNHDRDLVIEAFAASEACLLERVLSLEADVAVYREIACAALDALRTLTLNSDQLKRERDELRDTQRAQRERDLLQAGADDDEATES